MAKCSCIVSLVLVLGLVGPVETLAAGLRAGAARAVITPDLVRAAVYLAGFGHNRVATGVHDDLEARCLALEAGGTTLVLCSADLIGLFRDDVEVIRRKTRELAPGLSHLVVASTHNHQGPDTMGLWGPRWLESGLDEAYVAWVRERVAETAAQAIKFLRPARLTLARDDHPLLGNLQNDSRPPYVKDPFLLVMHLKAEENGESIATVVNFSSHPETLGSANTQITCDYPGWLRATIERQLGGVAIFFVGSIGGLLSSLGEQVVLLDPETGEVAQNGTWLKARLYGELLGDLSLHALKRGEEARITSIEVGAATLFVPLENDRFRVAAAAGVFKGRKPLFTDGRPDAGVSEKELPGFGRLKFKTGRDIQTEVNSIRLFDGKRPLAEIVTVPGEIYPELVNGGIERYAGADFPDAPFEPALRERLKSRYQFVFGLGNDEIGYIIPKAEWDDEPPWLLARPTRWYGEINSVGPEAAGNVMKALVQLIEPKRGARRYLPCLTDRQGSFSMTLGSVSHDPSLQPEGIARRARVPINASWKCGPRRENSPAKVIREN